MKSYQFLFRWVLLIFVLVMFGRVFGQDENEKRKDDLERLQKKVVELEHTIATLQTQLDSSKILNPEILQKSEQSDLEMELAKELDVQESAAPAKPGFTQSPAGQKKFFQNMNPNISVIGTVLGNGTTQEVEERNVDLSFHEAEFSFQAAVDPYAKADFYIAFGKQTESTLLPGSDETGEQVQAIGGLEPEMEEAYITVLSLPFSTQLKAGKFRCNFGKINETHPHAYNFIDVPLMYQNFFGPEGLNDEGASLSWLVPNGVFFQELTMQVTNGPLENASFARSENNRLLYLAHLKNFFDLNENTTLELGFTGLSGANNTVGDATHILAGDLTLRWKPLQQNRYKSFEFMSEFLISKRNAEIDNITSLGLYSFLRYQIAKRWFLGALYDYSEFPEFSASYHQAFSGILQFFATEFQKMEFQYKFNEGNFFDNFSEFKLRAVFVIGAHGAHKY